jgi:hypothetical protein
MRIGPAGVAKEPLKMSRRTFHRWRTRDGTDYRAPTQEELRVIELVSPLYMHTHPCYYQTQDHYGEPHGDADAVGYVRRDVWGVPASRKYSPETLQSRVLDNARRAGLDASVFVLRNAKDIAEGIYMHFILVLDKPQQLALPATGRPL